MWVSGATSGAAWYEIAIEVKVMSTSQPRRPPAAVTARMVAVASAVPAPLDSTTSPIRRARSSVR